MLTQKAMKWLRREYRGAKKDVRTFFGLWNILGSIGIIGLFAWTIFLPLLQGDIPETNQILVLLTAVYVLTSFNQMRAARENRQNHEASPVQSYYGYDESWGFKVPKLTNFGSTPAVSFQLLAQVEGIGDDPLEVKRIERYEDPVNLDPGKDISLMSDDLVEMLESPDSWSDEAELNLYYGFESIHTGTAPHAPGLGKSLNELEEEYPNPKSFQLEEILARFNQERAEPATEKLV